jgi:glycosyltransferase involved in cell wall biosynthesis
MPLVSIIVPTYNQANYLPMTLDAVLFQDHPDIELVIVNDGSTDGTARVIEDYLKAVAEETVSHAARFDEAANQVVRRTHPRYPQNRRIQVLTHDPNRGLGAALNTGFKAATGEFCTYIASDDVLLPSMVSDCLAAMDAAGADFAYADMHVVDDQGRILRRFSLPDYSFANCFGDWYFCGVCKLYRRSLHERLGWYREDLLSHDHELYQRFALGGAPFVHVPKVLANVRIHGKDRQVHNHTPGQWSRLFDESIALVREARRHISQGTAPKP